MKRGELEQALALLEKGDWRAAHEIVQRDEDAALACWAHGIVHLMEGDPANARYWFRQAKRPYADDIAGEIAALRDALKR